MSADRFRVSTRVELLARVAGIVLMAAALHFDASSDRAHTLDVVPEPA